MALRATIVSTSTVKIVSVSVVVSFFIALLLFLSSSSSDDDDDDDDDAIVSTSLLRNPFAFVNVVVVA